MAGGSANKSKILPHLVRNEGRVVFADEIAEETGLTRKQVQGVMYHLIATGDVKVEARGNAWVYHRVRESRVPSDPVVIDKLEVVGHTREGVMLARDPGGKLYTVRELDL